MFSGSCSFARPARIRYSACALESFAAAGYGQAMHTKNIAVYPPHQNRTTWPADRAFYTPARLAWRAGATVGVPRLTGVEVECILPGLAEALASAPEDEDEEEHNCCELLSATLRRIFGAWRCATASDASLPSDGIEIQTAPASGLALLRQVQDIAAALNFEHAEVDESCGAHVHVDVRDLSGEDLFWVTQAWRVTQPAVYLTVPYARRRSGYARPTMAFPPIEYAAARALSAARRIAVKAATYNQPSGNYDGPGVPDDSAMRDAISKYIAAQGSTEIRRRACDASGNRYCSARYHALNLHSVFYRRTIEFRLPNGTCREDDFVGWARLVNALITWSYRRRAVEQSVRQMHGLLDNADTRDDALQVTRIFAARLLYHHVAGALLPSAARELRSFLVRRWRECARKWFGRNERNITSTTKSNNV